MTAREKDGSSSWFGLPKWLALFFGVAAIAGVGFLFWLSVQAFSQSSTLDARRVRALDIAADYIAKWPAVATTIGQTSLFHQSDADRLRGSTLYTNLYHPEFGDFQVSYDRSKDKCAAKVEIDNNRLKVKGEALRASAGLSEPEKAYIERARKASWVRLGDDKQSVCFTIAGLDLKRVAPPLGSFSHLLLIKEPRKPDETSAPGGQQKQIERADWRDGRVVAWVGPSELPIRSLSDLPALDSEVTRVLAATVQAYATAPKPPAETKSRKKDALEPFDSRIAGKDYRFYWRPIVLDPPGEPQGADKLDSYYLVGVAPARATAETGRSRTQMLAFAFALFMLISLMPVVKLALLGPVDSMKAIEVAAICLGIVAAAALGTAFWTGVQDVLVARTAASTQVTQAAGTLSGKINDELHDVLFSTPMNQISAGLGKDAGAQLVVGNAEATQPATIAKVENLVLLDANGRQAAGTVMNAARDHVGTNFNLGDRVYFRRAIDEDFAPRTVQLAEARRVRDPCAIWNDIEEGLVFDQVRSRTDGAPKTIIAAKLKHPTQSLQACESKPTAPLSRDERLQPSVIVAAFVMPSMLMPKLAAGIRYAVLDVSAGASGRPVLFHSDSYRAGVEMFDESIDAHTLGRFSTDAGDPIECKAEGSTPEAPKQFSGVYEEEPTLFAVARVPCTDWAVVTFKSRQLIDAQAVKPAVHAIVVWASLMIIPYFLWMVAALRWGDGAWVWLWPEPKPAKKKAYLILTLALAGASVLAFVLVNVASPFTSFLICIVSALAALAWLFWVHYNERILAWLRRARTRFFALMQNDDGHDRPHLQDTSIQPSAPEHEAQKTRKRRNKLDDSTERRFICFAVALIVVLSVMPITALSADAHDYFALTSLANQEALTRVADRDRLEMTAKIARMEGMETKPVNDPQPSTVTADCHPQYYTENLRTAAGHEDRLTCRAKPTKSWVLGFPSTDLIDDFTLVSLALVLFLVLGLAIWASVWGLFGFGVPLEAVEYPELDVKEKGKVWTFLKPLPPRFLVIRANEDHLKALKQNAVELDLYDEIRTGRETPLPEGYSKEPRLVLIHNLGLVLGDPEARRKALGRLEQILVKQKAGRLRGRDDKLPNFRVAMLTSLTPLERLLQSFERERDENDQLDDEQKTAARLQRAKHREDMRWSAVFEEFTTYYHAARPRKKPPKFENESDAVKFVWKELEYVPDTAVAAMIWDPGPPVLDREIIKWARQITEKCDRPRAIVDFLASNLIEHYHLMWSLSSREERLLLYRIAYGHVPNVAKAYALRSLVKRGLVVLAPYPRTMNESFAQFVQHVEKQDTIKNWRRTQEHGSWDVARLPFALALPAAIFLLVVATVRSGDSFAAIIPLVVAAGPALINALSSARRTAAA